MKDRLNINVTNHLTVYLLVKRKKNNNRNSNNFSPVSVLTESSFLGLFSQFEPARLIYALRPAPG